MSNPLPNEKHVRPERFIAILDTNAIHPGEGADDSFSLCVNTLIEVSKTMPFPVSLYVSSTAANEREYQIIRRAQKLRDNLREAAKFFDIENLILPPDVELFVRNKFSNALKNAGILIAPLSHAKVDWERLIAASVLRQAPFALEGEKGFRDALIIESICQLLAMFSSDPRECQIGIVSKDKRFVEALKERLKSASNIVPVETREQLIQHLRAIASGLSQSEIETLLAQADLLFVDNSWMHGLWISERIEDKIKNQFKKDIQFDLPDYVTMRPGDVFISTPLFDGLKDNTVSFVTKVEFHFEAVLVIDEIEPGIMAQIAEEKRIGLSAITFEIEWNAIMHKDGYISSPTLKNLKPVLRKSFQSDYETNKKPQLLGILSPGEKRRFGAKLFPSDRFAIVKPTWME